MNSNLVKIFDLKYFIYALLITLPTYFFVRIEVYLVFIPIIIFEYWTRIQHLDLIAELKKSKLFLTIIGIVVFSFLNRLIHLDYENEGIKTLYSFSYLLPLLYFIAKVTLNKKVLKYLIYLLILEILLSYFEFGMGVSTFFKQIDNFYEFKDYSLLYNTRVLGLANNSSLFSEKILAGLILLDYSKIKFKKAITILMITALIITFNRTMIIAYVFYVLATNLYFLKSNLKDYIAYQKRTGVIHLLFIAFCIINAPYSINQFTRNNTKVTSGRVENEKFDTDNNFFRQTIESKGIEMSGRGEIWDNYFSFINNNLFLGNGSRKMLIGRHHAHNSIIEILASHGIIILFLYFFMIITSINKNNIIIISTFFIASLAQYFVFWPVSYLDIIIMWFLIPNSSKIFHYDP